MGGMCICCADDLVTPTGRCVTHGLKYGGEFGNGNDANFEELLMEEVSQNLFICPASVDCIRSCF